MRASASAQLQLAYPNLSLSPSPPHAPHQKPKKPCVRPSLSLSSSAPPFASASASASVPPFASARTGQTADSIANPRRAHDWQTSLYRPAPLPSTPRSPFFATPSPTLHTSAHTVGRERVVACGAGSLTQIQSILGTETTTVTDGTSIQDAALWSGQVGSCRVNLGHPLSISAAQFRARVSALLYPALSCSAHSNLRSQCSSGILDFWIL